MLHVISAIVLTVITASAGAAERYPVRPIRIVVTYVPGGNTDTAARLVAPHLTDHLGQQVIIDNRGGAGGVVGTEIAARAAPDGYTLLFGTSAGLTINPQLQPKLPYNVERDFAPISLLVINPQLMVAHPGLPAKTVGEFLKLARTQPGKFNYASVGVGSPNHLGMELLKTMTGIDIVHVPYKGSAPALTDLLGGQIEMMFDVLVTGLPHINANKLRALAVTGPKRSALLPNVPTMQEAGVKDYEAATWFGLLAPAGTSKGIVDALSAALDKALVKKDVQDALANQGAVVEGGTPQRFAAYLRSELDKWGKAVKLAGIKAE
jgi:tripartite-type tricarboxylate transporter receptor subunit TctC